jgi:hypothetical protein
VLDELAKVPVQKWNYKHEKDQDIPHIGPMAQDFKDTFYPGRDDKRISTLEFDGVELAAIKGLHQLVKEKESEIQELKNQLQAVQTQLTAQEAKWEHRFNEMEKAINQNSRTETKMLSVSNTHGE